MQDFVWAVTASFRSFLLPALTAQAEEGQKCLLAEHGRDRAQGQVQDLLLSTGGPARVHGTSCSPDGPPHDRSFKLAERTSHDLPNQRFDMPHLIKPGVATSSPLLWGNCNGYYISINKYSV